MRLAHPLLLAVLLIGLSASELTSQVTSAVHAKRVLFDHGHFNSHTSDAYADLVEGLEERGYEVSLNSDRFGDDVLDPYGILIIVNALSAYRNDLVPHTAPARRPAFDVDEVIAIERWVSAGGGLFLVADHYPYGFAAAPLASVFGVEMHGGLVNDTTHAVPGGGGNWIYFDRQNRLLGNHPITNGTDPTNQVERVETYTGQSLLGPADAVALLRLSPTAVDGVPPLLPDTVWTWESAAGRSQALALCHEDGRVFVAGEAAMFLDLYADGAVNAPFAFNVFAWLSGELDPACSS